MDLGISDVNNLMYVIRASYHQFPNLLTRKLNKDSLVYDIRLEYLHCTNTVKTCTCRPEITVGEWSNLRINSERR